jgi:hypothetical protein
MHLTNLLITFHHPSSTSILVLCLTNLLITFHHPSNMFFIIFNFCCILILIYFIFVVVVVAAAAVVVVLPTSTYLPTLPTSYLPAYYDMFSG